MRELLAMTLYFLVSTLKFNNFFSAKAFKLISTISTWKRICICIRQAIQIVCHAQSSLLNVCHALFYMILLLWLQLMDTKMFLWGGGLVSGKAAIYRLWDGLMCALYPVGVPSPRCTSRSRHAPAQILSFSWSLIVSPTGKKMGDK